MGRAEGLHIEAPMKPASPLDDCDLWLSASLRELVDIMGSRHRVAQPEGPAAQPLVEAIYAGDLAAAQALLAAPVAGTLRTGSAILEHILPAVYQIERNWTTDARSYTDTLYAFWNLQKLLNPSPPPGEAADAPEDPTTADGGASPCVILATAPGSEHTFGIQLVGDHFRALGWHPQVLLQTTHQSLLDLVGTRPVDVLGLSVGHDAALAGLSQLLVELRAASQNPALRIVLGGNIFTMSQVEYAWLGADCVARSADEAFNFCRLCSPQRFQ